MIAAIASMPSYPPVSHRLLDGYELGTEPNVLSHSMSRSVAVCTAMLMSSLLVTVTSRYVSVLTGSGTLSVSGTVWVHRLKSVSSFTSVCSTGTCDVTPSSC